MIVSRQDGRGEARGDYPRVKCIQMGSHIGEVRYFKLPKIEDLNV